MKSWKEMTAEEQQWSTACDKLCLQMLTSTFVHLFRRSRLVSLDPAVVEVRNEGVRGMLEFYWSERVAEALEVESVTFKAVKGDPP